MGIVCKMSGHKWNGCICARCGEKRDEGHQWVKEDNSCVEKCAVCGAIGRSEHKFERVSVADDPEICYHNVCRVCGHTEPRRHAFSRKNGCRYNYICSYCGREMIEAHEHDFYNHKCRDCGIFDAAVTYHGDFVTADDPDDKTISLIGYRGKETAHIVIPEGISYIDTNQFDNFERNDKIESVKFPSTLLRTGMNTFTYCENLKRVELNEGLTDIGQSAFCGCASLVEINFPQSLKTISYAAFSGCSSLGEIYLPDSVTEISSGVFTGCGRLIIRCHENSAAHRFAEKNNIRIKLLPVGPNAK